MCILNERNEKQEKRPTKFFVWCLINGKKEDVMKIESYISSKEDIKKLLNESNIIFDGVDVVK